MLDFVNSSLADMSMFPLKCPHCMVEIVIDDLESLLEPALWNKVLTLALNAFVSKRPDVMAFCFTAGCKQINMTKADHFDCDVCLESYCLECKVALRRHSYSTTPT